MKIERVEDLQRQKFSEALSNDKDREVYELAAKTTCLPGVTLLHSGLQCLIAYWLPVKIIN